MKSFKNKRVFITGAHGFIGSNLIKRLVGFGAEVHIVERKDSNNWRLKEVRDKITKHNIDFDNKAEITKKLKIIHPDIIYNLASYGGHYSEQDTDTIININLLQNINFFSALKEIKFDFFVNTGSSSEYGFKTKPMKETDLLEPVSFYAATKASTTLLGQVFAKKHGMPIATIRPFSVYGPFESKSKLIPTAIISCLKEEVLQLNSCEAKHDYIYIDDVIDAYVKVPFLPKSIGEVINIGTGKQYSNKKVISEISKIAKMPLKIKKGAFPKLSWDTNYWLADNRKAKRLLNWEPKYSLREGLKKTISWFSENLEHYSS